MIENVNSNLSENPTREVAAFSPSRRGSQAAGLLRANTWY